MSLYSVNWQDGMLLSQQRFQEQERFFEELARWYAVQAGNQYGLVRKGSGAPPALRLNMAVSGKSLRVEVLHCQAVTSDGHAVDIDEAAGQAIRAGAPLADGELPVFISIDPAEKVPLGEADPQEEIPRLPYRVPKYALHLGERPELADGQLLQVALLTVKGSEVTYSPSFLPPCVTLYADERLHDRVTELRNRLETLLSVGNRAYVTITGAAAGSGERTDISKGLEETIYHFVNYLSSTLDEFVVGRNAGHPLTMVVFCKRLFRVFHTLLDLRPGIKDYVHEKYFVKEAGSDISRFMSSVDGFLLADYNHEDIGGHIRAIEALMEQIRGLLGYLAQVKEEQLGPQAVATDSLTYQGRTYSLVAHSSSKIERVGELTYLEVHLAEPRPMTDTIALLSKSLFSLPDWSRMQVRLGLNEARGLGETDPVEIDAVTYGDKVALHPHDMLKAQSIRQMTMIFRGVKDAQTFSQLGKMDLFIYAV